MRGIVGLLSALAVLGSAPRPLGAEVPPVGGRRLVCLAVAGISPPGVLVLGVTGAGGPFLGLAGELVLPSAGAGFPVRGSAHRNAAGQLHLGLRVSVPAPGSPASLLATLDGPAFASGTGSTRFLTGSESATALTLTGTDCPDLPE